MKLSMPGIAVLLVLTVIALSFAVTPVIAQPAEVRVNAPEYVDVGATFVVTIDVDSITDLNSAQFDLSFNPDVVKISEIKKGKINGEGFSTFVHRFITEDTVRVLAVMPFGEAISGSGHIAEVEFDARGEKGEKSELSIPSGELVNATGGIIPSNWHGAEIMIGEEKEEEEDEEEEVGEEVTPGSPNITAWNPAEAVVSTVVGEPRTFNISINQIAVISWQINGTEVQTNESVTEAVFTNKSADIGTWNVSAIATNTTTGLSDMHTWIWSVTLTATVTPTSTPTLEPGAMPTPTPTLAPGVTPKPTPSPTLEPGATPTPTPAVPGFEVIFAIAGTVGIAYMQLRRR